MSLNAYTDSSHLEDLEKDLYDGLFEDEEAFGIATS